MKLALIQSDIVWNDPRENVRRCKDLASQALAAQGHILIFPEMFTCGFSMPTGKLAEESEAIGKHFLRSVAEQHGVYTIGSLPEVAPDGKLYNTSWVFAPDGSSSSYRKVHLFSFGDEAKLYSAGTSMCTTTVRLGSASVVRCTVLICYDLRFANLFLARAPQTDLFVIVANWPASRREHWLTLLRARAIETQAYVAGVNRVGTGGGLTYSGDSAVFAPDGVEVGRLPNKMDVLHCEIDPQTVASWRSTFPALRDRRSDVYAQLATE